MDYSVCADIARSNTSRHPSSSPKTCATPSRAHSARRSFAAASPCYRETRSSTPARSGQNTLRFDPVRPIDELPFNTQRTDTDGGFGLAQVRERMASLPGGAGSVQVSSQPGQGTTVRLTLPLQITP